MTMTSSTFPTLRPLACLLAAALALSACGGEHDGDAGAAGADGPAGRAGLLPLTGVQAEPAGVHCAFGGSRIDAGLDLDADRTLDPAEVTSTQYVCHGSAQATAATSLVRVSAEAAGSHCTLGGSRIDAGVDGNANGVLDAAEVRSTAYVCQSSTGNTGPTGATGPTGSSGTAVLTAIAAETAGANCAQGGQRVTLGADTNGNGALDTAEVTSTRYLCNGAPAAELTWQAVTGPTAATAGGNYLATGGAQVVVTLPATAGLQIGDTVRVSGAGSGGWRVAQNAGQSILGLDLPVNYLSAPSNWVQRSATVGWEAAASSFDGQRLVAITDTEIHTSSDRGVTWNLRHTVVTPGGSLSDVASSHDGQRLVAVAYNGLAYTSTDAGLTWTARDSNRGWIAVASSADGLSLIAAVINQPLRQSLDGGQTWSALAGSPSAFWYGVASSADGQKLAAVVAGGGGQIHVSSDGGSTWTASGAARNWYRIASSSDGRQLVVAEWQGNLHVSADAGATWSVHAGSERWYRVASSANGAKLLAVAPNDGYAFSSDSGTTWNEVSQTTSYPHAAAVSGDGNTFVMGDQFGAGGLHTAINDRSTPGTTGSLSGQAYDTIELQYLGAGQFRARSFSSHAGSFLVQ